MREFLNGIVLLIAIAYILYNKQKLFMKFKGTGIIIFLKRKIRQLNCLFKRYGKFDKAYYYTISSIIICLMAFFLFLNIVDHYFQSGTFRFDARVFGILEQLRSPALNFLFKSITSMGNFLTMLIMVCIICWLLFRKSKILEMYLLPASVIGVWLFNTLLKSIYKRPRPSDINLINAEGYSFPSGHAMIFMSFALILIYYILTYVRNRKVASVFSAVIFIFALLVGISRVYLGVHYFSDVISGWLVAILWGFSNIAVYRTLANKNNSPSR